MARIVGVDLPREKRVEIGLTYIFGMGRSRALQALTATGVDPNTRVRDLTDADVIALRDYIEANFETEGDLRREVQADIRRKTIALRTSTSKELEAWGYPVIPSQTNFFMVSLHDKTVQPTIQAFREKNILVGRPFPPMLNHLRVSIGRDEDMAKFLTAFKEIFPKRAAVSSTAAPVQR